MARTRAVSPRAPEPLGTELLLGLTPDEVVAALGVPHRSRAAFWRLVAIGPEARPAVRSGLTSPNPAVRRGCCEVLDLRWDDAAAEDVAALLADPDADVRWMAAHALTCERCKRETWATRQPRSPGST